MVEIFFAGRDSSVKIPTKKNENAGYDIYANFDEPYIWIKPNSTVMIPTGLYSACEPEYFFYVAERGSTGSKGIGRRCGVIDSGYRGEWFVAITNHNDKPLIIVKKDFEAQFLDDDFIKYPYEKAICQTIVLPVPKTTVNHISLKELQDIPSERGDGKLGSSKK